MDMLRNQRKLKQLNSRLKGWHKHFKGRFLLLKDLTEGEYVLWDFSFSILADWHDDPRRDTYGTFFYSFADIANELKCDASVISRRSKKLFRLGLWKKLDDGSIEVCGFNIRDHLTVLTKDVDIPIDLQSYIANQQVGNAITNNQLANIHEGSTKEIDTSSPQINANMHDDAPKEPLISFKDESNVPIKKVIVKGSSRSNKEYQKLHEESGMSVEDMKAIDDSISESYIVTEENELYLVDTFFNGDWEKYRKNIYFAKKSVTDKSGL
jgi:hypothetical protein